VDDGGGVGRRGSGVLPVYVATVMSSTKQKPMLTMRVGRVLGVFHKALLNEYTDLRVDVSTRRGGRKEVKGRGATVADTRRC